MSDPAEPPKQTQIPIDAVAGYFQKRMVAAENECLLLSSQVRDLTNHIRQQADAMKQLQAIIEEMRAAKAIETVEPEIIAPKPRRKAAH